MLYSRSNKYVSPDRASHRRRNDSLTKSRAIYTYDILNTC